MNDFFLFFFVESHRTSRRTQQRGLRQTREEKEKNR